MLEKATEVREANLLFTLSSRRKISRSMSVLDFFEKEEVGGLFLRHCLYASHLLGPILCCSSR